jgi:hypothetical protein
MTDISIDVGHLSVDAGPTGPASGPSLGRGVETALTRLVEQHGLPPSLSADLPSLAGPSLALPPGADQSQIADAIARAIYRALAGERVSTLR